MKEIKYKDFDKEAQKLCATHEVQDMEVYDVKSTCLQLSMISMFLEDSSLDYNIKKEITLKFVKKT